MISRQSSLQRTTSAFQGVHSGVSCTLGCNELMHLTRVSLTVTCSGELGYLPTMNLEHLENNKLGPSEDLKTTLSKVCTQHGSLCKHTRRRYLLWYILQEINKSVNLMPRGTPGTSVIMRRVWSKIRSLVFYFILRRRMCTRHLSEVFTAKDSTRQAEDLCKSCTYRVHAPTFLICTSLTVQWKLFTQACVKVIHNTNYPLDVTNLSS